MRVRIIFLMLFIIPLFSYSQFVKSWKLYINQKKVLSVKGDSVLTVLVHKNDTSTMRFVFSASDTAFKRKVIVMDNQRNGIDDRNITEKGCKVTFNVQKLYQESKGENVTFYIVNIPADPAKAALVRVAPHPFCNLQWLK
jgi:hypothetical protein